MAIAKAGAQEPGANSSPQGENKAFMKDQSKEKSGYLMNTVHPAEGQHEIIAGSVIPAVMLTGIDSDLPGTISAQVRQTCGSIQQRGSVWSEAGSGGVEPTDFPKRCYHRPPWDVRN